MKLCIITQSSLNNLNLGGKQINPSVFFELYTSNKLENTSRGKKRFDLLKLNNVNTNTQYTDTVSKLYYIILHIRLFGITLIPNVFN